MVDDMPIYEIAIAVEVFGTRRPDLADPWYELRICASSPENTRALGGFAVATGYGLDAVADAGTVIVPALPEHSVDPPAELVAAVRAAKAGGARVVSLCTGAFALAAAGLLDGRPATTHWLHAGTLAERYPSVRVDESVLYVDDGDVLTSAGRTAGLDLCLHLVRADLGAHVANQLARRLVVPAHRPGGQAQYIETPVSPCDDDSLVPVLNWAVENMGRQLTVTELSRHAGMSSRTLVRRFHEATGTTPMRWLQEQRIGRARELLESSSHPVDRISELCGLGTASNLRFHFIRSVGVSPTEYRRAFRGGQPDRLSAVD